MVFAYCERNQIANKFDSETRQAGRGWIREILKRHHELSLQKPESTSIQRAIGFNKSKVETQFSILGKTLFETGQ